MERKQGYKIMRYRKQLVAVVIVSVVLLGAFYLVWSTYFRPPPWLFKGAYAKYYGETSWLFITAKITVHIEVLDFNATHFKTLTSMKVDSPVGKFEEQTAEWHSFSEEPKAHELTKEYETSIHVDALKITRECIVKELKDRSAVYYDKQTGQFL